MSQAKSPCPWLDLFQTTFSFIYVFLRRYILHTYSCVSLYTVKLMERRREILLSFSLTHPHKSFSFLSVVIDDVFLCLIKFSFQFWKILFNYSTFHFFTRNHRQTNIERIYRSYRIF